MLNIGLQFFAHKKGVGSTRNGRNSEAKRGATVSSFWPATSLSASAAPTFTPVSTWVRAAMIPCSL